jgi:hypothetical protein
MKVEALGQVGTAVSDANVPVLAPGEKTIGFRELEYTLQRGTLFKKTLVPWRKGWVYQTSHRVICLDEGWEESGGAKAKRLHEVTFAEVFRVEHKKREVVLHLAVAEGKHQLTFRPFGAAARLFDWLQKEKERRVEIEAGRAESPYRKAREESE